MTDLIKQARELCEKAEVVTTKQVAHDLIQLKGMATALADALEAMTTRAEKAEAEIAWLRKEWTDALALANINTNLFDEAIAERDTYRQALINSHEDEERSYRDRD